VGTLSSELLVQALVFLAGLLAGGFATTCIHRMPQDRSVWVPGSECPSCGQRLPWGEQIPVISWIALRGKCRHCDSAVPATYPLFEACAGLLVLLRSLRRHPLIPSRRAGLDV